MQTRYVPVTAEGIEALSVAAAGVADGPIRQALAALVRAYESSTTGVPPQLRDAGRLEPQVQRLRQLAVSPRAGVARTAPRR